MKRFNYICPETMEEACETLKEYNGRARLKAGGTDILQVLKDDILPEYPEALVNMAGINDITGIREDGEYLKIGAMTTLHDIACSDIVRYRYGVLAEAARSVATPQIRNIATIGGNLCQDVRCWYYRYPARIGGPVKCLRKGNGPCLALKGDNRYHSITAGKGCFAVCPSDTAVALTALNARVTVSGPLKKKRNIAVQDIYDSRTLKLEKDEIIREISIPVLKEKGVKQHFMKFTLRKPVDYAIVNAASVIRMEKDLCDNVRIVLGAVAPGPFQVEAAEKLIEGNPLTDEIIGKASEEALKDAVPLSKNGYKIQIARNLIKKTIL